MKTLKIIVLMLVYMINYQLSCAQSALDAANQTLDAWYSLLDGGKIQTFDGKYKLTDYTIQLDSTVIFQGANSDRKRAESVFKITGKVYYTLNDGIYEFSGNGIDALTREETGEITKSNKLFRIVNFTKVKADSLVLLFDKISKELNLVNAEANRLDIEKEAKTLASKKAFHDKIKTVDINKHFFNMSLPNTHDKSVKEYTVYENPLRVGDRYYSGFKFTPTMDGYLYWYFYTFEENETNFYLIDSDKNADDLEVSYFRKIAYVKDGNNKSWVLQKSAEKLKKGKTYVLWFEANAKITPHKKKIFAKIEATDKIALSEYFKNQFNQIIGDF